MNWRHRRANEIDHELVWLAVSTASFALAVVWLKLRLPFPVCVFHKFTGFACPTCGSTRCFLDLSGGHFGPAFFWNPLAFCALAGILLFDCYALAVLLFRQPRLRFDNIPRRVANKLRPVAALAIALNWLYLVHAGR
jgi:hypothetical protein